MSQMRHDLQSSRSTCSWLAGLCQPAYGRAASPHTRVPVCRATGASPARTQMAVSGHLRHSSSRCAIAVDRLAAAMRARRMSPPSGKTRKRGVLRSCCCGCACAAAAVLAALMLLRLRLRCCGCACSRKLPKEHHFLSIAEVLGRSIATPINHWMALQGLPLAPSRSSRRCVGHREPPGVMFLGESRCYSRRCSLVAQQGATFSQYAPRLRQNEASMRNQYCLAKRSWL